MVIPDRLLLVGIDRAAMFATRPPATSRRELKSRSTVAEIIERGVGAPVNMTVPSLGLVADHPELGFVERSQRSVSLRVAEPPVAARAIVDHSMVVLCVALSYVQ